MTKVVKLSIIIGLIPISIFLGSKIIDNNAPTEKLTNEELQTDTTLTIPPPPPSPPQPPEDKVNTVRHTIISTPIKDIKTNNDLKALEARIRDSIKSTYTKRLIKLTESLKRQEKEIKHLREANARANKRINVMAKQNKRLDIVSQFISQCFADPKRNCKMMSYDKDVEEKFLAQCKKKGGCKTFYKTSDGGKEFFDGRMKIRVD